MTCPVRSITTADQCNGGFIVSWQIEASFTGPFSLDGVRSKMCRLCVESEECRYPWTHPSTPDWSSSLDDPCYCPIDNWYEGTCGFLTTKSDRWCADAFCCASSDDAAEDQCCDINMVKVVTIPLAAVLVIIGISVASCYWCSCCCCYKCLRSRQRPPHPVAATDAMEAAVPQGNIVLPAAAEEFAPPKS